LQAVDDVVSKDRQLHGVSLARLARRGNVSGKSSEREAGIRGKASGGQRAAALWKPAHGEAGCLTFGLSARKRTDAFKKTRLCRFFFSWLS